jgi:hypothetical protein
MSTESSVYLGFSEEVSRHTWNLDFTAWVVYSLEGQLVSSSGVFLGPSMNNVVKYSVITEILGDVVSHCIHFLEVLLESQLVVC